MLALDEYLDVVTIAIKAKLLLVSEHLIRPVLLSIHHFLEVLEVVNVGDWFLLDRAVDNVLRLQRVYERVVHLHLFVIVSTLLRVWSDEE